MITSLEVQTKPKCSMNQKEIIGGCAKAQTTEELQPAVVLGDFHTIKYTHRSVQLCLFRYLHSYIAARIHTYTILRLHTCTPYPPTQLHTYTPTNLHLHTYKPTHLVTYRLTHLHTNIYTPTPVHIQSQAYKIY